MREQVVAQKVVNRSGISAKRRNAGMVQKPVRRERGGGGLWDRLRSGLSYLPVVLKVAVAIAVGVLIFTGYRAAASASLFQLRSVVVQGTARESADGVRQIVKRELAATGVWQADLTNLSQRLERLPWIRTAVVSRVLPDGIRVRVVERTPRAVVRTAAGKFRWVDEDAVLLGEMVSADSMPPFFLRGLAEDDSENSRRENRERVRVFLQVQSEWETTGLADRLSEVNLTDLRDVRAQLAGNDSQIEVRLGGDDLGKRLKKALEVLDEQRQTARGQFISYVDVSQGKRAVIGFVSGAHALTQATEPVANGAPSEVADDSQPNAKPNGRSKAEKETKEPKPKTRRSEDKANRRTE